MTARLGVGLLVVAALAVGIAGTEIAYRTARRFVCLPASPPIFAVRSWGWGHRPGADVEYYGCLGRDFEFRTRVAINSRGIRDREIPYAKPAGTRRVLFLGDSITEAFQVPLEQSFVKRAETALRASGANVELVNAAVAGYGTDSELLFYQEEGRRYGPDLVVLVLNLQNDIYENSEVLHQRANARAAVGLPPKPAFHLEPDGTLRLEPSTARPLAPGWRRWITERLYLARVVDRVIAPPVPATGPSVGPLGFEAYAPWTSEWTDAWRLTARLIVELRRVVERGGARFAVVVVPAKEMAEPEWFRATVAWFHVPPQPWDLERTHRAAVDLLQQEAIPFLDLYAALFERKGFFQWDVHLNENGHAAVAPPVAEFVRRRLDAVD